MGTGDITPAEKVSIEIGGIKVESVQGISSITMGTSVVEATQGTSTNMLLAKMEPGSKGPGKITITRAEEPVQAILDVAQHELQPGEGGHCASRGQHLDPDQ